MSIRIWRGDAPAIAQVTRVTPANVEVGDIFRLTINGKTVSFTAVTATAASVAAGLAAVWNASTLAEFAEVTASVDGNDLVLAADRAGAPFVVTSATTNGGATDDQTLTLNTTSAATGPNFWNAAGNWTGGAVPITGDEVHLVDSDVDILYGLDQTAVAPSAIYIDQSYTGRVGLPAVSDSGYVEYRNTSLKIAAAAIHIGRGSGVGSARIKLDTGTTATTLNVFNTGNAEEGPAAVLWRGTSTSANLNVLRGTVGVALRPDESATLGDLRMALDPTAGGDATVILGPGTTVSGAIEKSGGKLRFGGSSLADLTQYDGETTIEFGSVTALAVRGGTVIYNSTGALATATVSSAGKLDFSHDLRTKTVSAPIEVFGSQARVSDPFQVVDNLVLDLNETALSALDIGTNIRISRSIPT